MSAAQVLNQHHQLDVLETVPAMVEDQIRTRSKEVAVIAGRRRITYGQFGILADKVGELLADAQITAGDVVALCIPPSPEFAAAAFAIMSAGAAYLPIDENCPAERVSFMVEDSGARLLITSSRISPSLRAVSSIAIAEIDRVEKLSGIKAYRMDSLGPENRAYIIYTSGSTGEPKGVELAHRGLSNLVVWHNQTFRIGHQDPKAAEQKNPFREGSKAAQVYALLGRPEGATGREIEQLTGWERHSVRGFLSAGVRKQGYKLRLFLRAGERRS